MRRNLRAPRTKRLLRNVRAVAVKRLNRASKSADELVDERSATPRSAEQKRFICSCSHHRH